LLCQHASISYPARSEPPHYTMTDTPHLYKQLGTIPGERCYTIFSTCNKA